MNEISNSLENPPKKSEFQEKNEHTVLPGNNYLNQENTPNFESNVLDTSKLYKIQNKKSIVMVNGKNTRLPVSPLIKLRLAICIPLKRIKKVITTK